MSQRSKKLITTCIDRFGFLKQLRERACMCSCGCVPVFNRGYKKEREINMNFRNFSFFS